MVVKSSDLRNELNSKLTSEDKKEFARIEKIIDTILREDFSKRPTNIYYGRFYGCYSDMDPPAAIMLQIFEKYTVAGWKVYYLYPRSNSMGDMNSIIGLTFQEQIGGR